jgi:Raf kinase inhibitor-like YbhB/YbcL family protein
MLENLPGAIGHALRDQRAGLESLVIHRSGLRTGLMALDMQSLSFKDHAALPPPYTADGEGLSPALHWTGVPAEAQQLVLIVEDADSPTPKPLVHAILVNLPPEDAHLPEGALQSPAHDAILGDAVREGRNSYLQVGWLPPDPPPGHGVHRYAFQLFALNAAVDWPATPGREALLEAVEAHAIAAGMIIGTYERPDGSIPTHQARAATVAIQPDAAGPATAPGLAPA